MKVCRLRCSAMRHHIQWRRGSVPCLRHVRKPGEDVLRAVAGAALAVRRGGVGDHGAFHDVLQAEAPHREVGDHGLDAVRGRLEALRAGLLVQRQAAGVLAETEEPLVVRILADGLLQAVHIKGRVIPELPDRHVLGDPWQWQAVPRGVEAVKVSLLAHRVHELRVAPAVAEEPVPCAEVLEDEGEELAGPVHEEVAFCVHGHAQGALLGMPQHGVEEGGLPQRLGRRLEDGAADVYGEDGA
mmetsp:Transcript_24511/g.76340  ORF Transcript_24511/g.76340 Transcript_24511/m.76340 type:complete len:242 (+) Transcript_24511:204-929(+)